MRKRKMMGKIFGIALVLSIIGLTLDWSLMAGSSSVPDLFSATMNSSRL